MEGTQGLVHTSHVQNPEINPVHGWGSPAYRVGSNWVKMFA